MTTSPELEMSNAGEYARLMADDDTRAERLDKRTCARCGQSRTDTVDSDICGSCADDLRDNQAYVDSDYHESTLPPRGYKFPEDSPY